MHGEVRAGAESASCAAALRQLTCLTKFRTTHVRYQAAVLDSLVGVAAALPVLQEVCIYGTMNGKLQSACASAREVAADIAHQQAATLRAIAASCATAGAWAHICTLWLDCPGTFDTSRLGNKQQVTAMTSDMLRQHIEHEVLQQVIEWAQDHTALEELVLPWPPARSGMLAALRAEGCYNPGGCWCGAAQMAAAAEWWHSWRRYRCAWRWRTSSCALIARSRAFGACALHCVLVLQHCMHACKVKWYIVQHAHCRVTEMIAV